MTHKYDLLCQRKLRARSYG